MKENILRTIENLQLSHAIQFKNLSIVPIFYNATANATTVNYISLKKGLEEEKVEITEISEGGSVPELKVTNNAAVPLFILDGEELVGAKQNRIVNTSMLLAAKASFVVPVSCTEQGRWRYNSRKFEDSGVVMSSSARYSKSRRVYANLMQKKGYNAEQSQVWNDIETMHSKYATTSRTRAMKDAFIQKENNIKDYLEAFALQAGQVGMMVFQNGKLIGGEMIGNTKVYADLHEKLIKSFAIEAMHEKVEVQPAAFDLEQEALQNLQIFKIATATEHQPIGLGKDIRLEAATAKASVLEYENEVIHLSVFPKIDVNKNAEEDGVGVPNSPRPHSRWGLGNRLHRRRGNTRQMESDAAERTSNVQEVKEKQL